MPADLRVMSLQILMYTTRILDWLAIPVVLVAFLLYRHSKRITLRNIPGPKRESFLYGNLREVFRKQAGLTEFKWHAEYGPIVRIPAPLGQDVLFISDPKAIHHIYQVSGYRYIRQRPRQLVGQLLSGKGLTNVNSQDHRRQRRVMQPSFGAAESRALVPIFLSCAEKMSGMWQDLLQTSGEESIVFDLHAWISRATLDAIGLAAFDYEFGALDDSNNPLTRVYKNIFRDVFGSPSNASIFTMSAFKYIPSSLVKLLLRRIKSPRLQRLREVGQLSKGVARDLVKRKKDLRLEGFVNKDVMSSMLKANASENPGSKLLDEELLSSLQVLILAGHETTANSFSWTVVELAKQLDIQRKLRQEIRDTERKIRERGDNEFTAQDLDSMLYLNSVVKEVLRFHPAAPNIVRDAGVDDVLPLSKPLTLANGKIVNEILIPKGTTVYTSIAAYNRNPEIFGDDAHSFNPDRWTKLQDSKQGTSIGVYANLFTFSGGNRSCIGWRFAVIELQAFIASVFGKFEVSLAVPHEKIRRESCGIMITTLEGEVEKGCQLPIRIKAVSSDEDF